MYMPGTGEKTREKCSHMHQLLLCSVLELGVISTLLSFFFFLFSKLSILGVYITFLIRVNKWMTDG